jgi:hypothetical protein
MAERSRLVIAQECIRRATAEVEIWLALVEQGQLATVSPFGQMFVYQLKRLEKLGDKGFAIDELYKLYYRQACGEDPPPAYDALST